MIVNNNSYGVVCGPDNIYTDVSMTLKGAKRYATNHSFDKVGIRYNSGYVCKVVAIKINNKWKGI
jgi:hypothetical protein